MKKVIVGIPAYNEERHIGSVVLLAKKYAGEVLVVDDGSIDNTAVVAELAGASVISHAGNKGYGITVSHILLEAKNRNADILVLIDADGQHNPKEIPRAISAILAGSDLAVGSRKLQKNQIPFCRLMGQAILTMLTRFMSYKCLTDSESGFRAFSKRALNTLNFQEKGMAISAATIIIAFDKGLNFAEFPISVSYHR